MISELHQRSIRCTIRHKELTVVETRILIGSYHKYHTDTFVSTCASHFLVKILNRFTTDGSYWGNVLVNYTNQFYQVQQILSTLWYFEIDNLVIYMISIFES